MSELEKDELWVKDNKTPSHEKNKRVVLAKKIKSKWLSSTVELAHINLKGELKSALIDLVDVAKAKKLALPTTGLRLLIMSTLNGVISVDRFFNTQGRTDNAAITCFSPGIEMEEQYKSSLVYCFESWITNTLGVWCKNYELEGMLEHIPTKIASSHFDLKIKNEKYKEVNHVRYGLIASAIANRLDGEVLHEGLSQSKIILNQYGGNQNTIELMTLPQRSSIVKKNPDYYSMAVRVGVVTLPFSDDVYLTALPVKRVWANRLPSSYSNSNRATAYIMSEGQPIIPVDIIKKNNSWDFDESTYAIYQNEANFNLPVNLEDAVGSREYDPNKEWWSGVQQLPALYSYVSPRTVFEKDEKDILDAVYSKLTHILSDEDIDFKNIKLPRKAPKSQQEMLKLSDFGTAGAIFESSENSDELDVDKVVNNKTRLIKLQKYREQNIKVLQTTHKDKIPTVWMVGGNAKEQELTKSTISTLFGDAVKFEYAITPKNTHGIKSSLPSSDKKARERFDSRVKCWSDLTKKIKENDSDAYNVILICQPDRINNKPEDQVNYFAGIHAASLINANVHHVLPITNLPNNNDEQHATQDFVYRLQSALLDVMLAHTGSILGVNEFVNNLGINKKKPNYIYGIQVLSSKAQSYSGQKNIDILQYSRLNIESGKTEIQFVYKTSMIQKTNWKPLENALTWLGSKRDLESNQAKWIDNNFEKQTIQLLTELNKVDPYAIILIDYQTVRNLWKGISDANLSNFPARLGDLELSRFKDMTFIRLRHGRNSITVRTQTKEYYKRMDEKGGLDSSHYKESGYLTSNKAIIELNSRNSGTHFIGMMGYPDTFRLQRGLSSYKDIYRMKKDPEAKKLSQSNYQVYRFVKFTPCDKDASIPAPMDITVLTSANGIDVSAYPKLVMGLRVGFAHYNDWTKLPAPLFFIRKTRDYIIRYDSPTDKIAFEDIPTNSNTDLSDFVVDNIVGSDIDKNKVGSELSYDMTPIVKDNDDNQDTSQYHPLIAQALQSPPFDFFETNELKIKRMRYSMFNRTHTVNLRVPWWVSKNNTFITNVPISKQGLHRCWKFMRDYGYVKETDKRIKHSDYLKWLSDKLNIPQSLSGIISVTRHICKFNFRELSEIINNEYNITAEDEEVIDPFFYSQDDADLLLKWGVENKHDAVIGWLIFIEAHNPDTKTSKDLFTKLPDVFGPRTESALHYYIDSSKIIDEYISIAGHGKIKLVKELTENTIFKPEKKLISETKRNKPRSKVNANNYKDDSFMKNKAELIALIDSLEIGDDKFDHQIGAINNILTSMADMNISHIEMIEAESKLKSKLNELIEKQGQLEGELNDIFNDLEVSNITSNAFEDNELDVIEAELSVISENIAKLLGLYDELFELNNESGRTLSIIQKQSKLTSNITDQAEDLSNIVKEGICYSFIDFEISDNDDSHPQSDDYVEDIELNKEKDIQLNGGEQTDVFSEKEVTQEENNDTGKIQLESNDKENNHTKEEAEPAEVIEIASKAEKVSSEIFTKEPEQLPVNSKNASSNKTISFELPNSEKLFEREIPTLQKLLSKRLYGIGEVLSHAMLQMVKSDNDHLLPHAAIATGINNALYNMDCKECFKFSINDELLEVLDSDNIQNSKISSSVHTGLGIFAAGLPFILFDNDIRWLFMQHLKQRFVDIKALDSLLEYFDNNITQFDYQISPSVISSIKIGEERAIENHIAKMHKRACSWSTDDLIHKSFRHLGYKSVNNYILSQKSPLGKCMQLIADKVTDIQDIKREIKKIENLKDSRILTDAIKKNNEHIKPDGLYRDNVIKNIKNTREFISSYVELLDSKKKDKKNNNKLKDFIDKLCKKMHSAAEEIKSIQAHTSLEKFYASSSLSSLNEMIRLFEESESKETCIEKDSQKLLLQLPLDKNLMPVMYKIDNNTEALCSYHDVYKEVNLLVTSGFLENGKEEIIDYLTDAYQGHLSSKRILPLNMIDDALNGQQGQKGKSTQQYLQYEIINFTSELQNAESKVMHAILLDAIPDNDESSRMQKIISKLGGLTKSEHPPGTLYVDSEDYVDYPQMRAALNSNVNNLLVKRFQESKDQILKRLNTLESTGKYGQQYINQINDLLKSDEPSVLRTANDQINLLKSENRLPKKTVSSEPIASVFEKTIEELCATTETRKHLLSAGLPKILSVDQSKETDITLLAKLDNDQRNEAKQFINNWINFFNVKDAYNESVVGALFRDLGMTEMPYVAPENVHNDKRVLFQLSNKNFIHQYSSDDITFIPPILGSWASVIQCCVLWGSVNNNDIRSAIQSIGHNTVTIILARTQLSMDDRAEVTGSSPVIIIDDNLIAFMALNPRRRFETLMHVGLQTFHANPYGDYGAKPVATEMFFGRINEINKLINITGVAILYGGRRLGKTSLLSETVERLRNTPKTKALTFSLQEINTDDILQSCWSLLYRHLEQNRIVSAFDKRDAKWNVLKEHIEKNLKTNKNISSLYIFMDEAEDLMKVELDLSEKCDSFVRSISSMSEELSKNCNVRVVFAGLNNVTRMANDPNSVFGKFETIALEPFANTEELSRGIRMITKPLNALGYIFDNDDINLPLRIMSICNSYPSFIQMYCKRLMERLQNNRQTSKPPIVITKEDLNAVEEDKNLLSELRELFKLNLNLDQRYKAIALILAGSYYEQMSTDDNNGLSVSEIREQCESFCPNHFTNASTSVYEALLDEMIKLNVLQSNDYRYHLRNPHVAMMIGVKESIDNLLTELAEQKPEKARSSSERHIRMQGKGKNNILFPLPSGWINSRIAGDNSKKLIILTGNDLSGIKELPSNDRDPWTLITTEDYITMLGKGANSLEAQISSYKKPNIHRPRLIVVRENSWGIDDIPEFARVAQRAASIGKGIGIQIVLIASPERAYELAMQNKTDGMDDTNPHPWTIEGVQTWNEDSVYFYNRENIEIISDGTAIDNILKASCGYGALIQTLCNSSLSVSKAEKAFSDYKEKYAGNLEKFLKAVGMPPLFIKENKEKIKDFLLSINGESRGNAEELNAHLEICGFDVRHYHFLTWMGVLQHGDNFTWKVPELIVDDLN